MTNSKKKEKLTLDKFIDILINAVIVTIVAVGPFLPFLFVWWLASYRYITGWWAYIPCIVVTLLTKAYYFILFQSFKNK